MTPEQAAAYIMSQAIGCFAEISGMNAENLASQQVGDPPPYTADAFDDIINQWGLHHNSVMDVIVRANNIRNYYA